MNNLSSQIKFRIRNQLLFVTLGLLLLTACNFPAANIEIPASATPTPTSMSATLDQLVRLWYPDYDPQTRRIAEASQPLYLISIERRDDLIPGTIVVLTALSPDPTVKMMNYGDEPLNRSVPGYLQIIILRSSGGELKLQYLTTQEFSFAESDGGGGFAKVADQVYEIAKDRYAVGIRSGWTFGSRYSESLLLFASTGNDFKNILDLKNAHWRNSVEDADTILTPLAHQIDGYFDLQATTTFHPIDGSTPSPPMSIAYQWNSDRHEYQMLVKR